ncbi:threonine--tRNA ligase [Fervidicoccus fontis]|uniref:Threonine--tRNA ligase n=1 Tax=Fervidicoccus fontis (strain DSM 19380 / JCM 18336 / VKM B-2539 / Kam940) TaxID=1163730 RepID=I0A2H9_FERFK|nr:threonine--tRNA ligase [Fervidicoccus fontis]AFH43186.1 threonyl-tRNA synthetase [Fervidicoccus fontis Kam940]
MVEISIIDKVINIESGRKIDVNPNSKLGSPIFIYAVTKERKKEVFPIDSVVKDDWEKAEVVFFFSKKGLEVFMDTLGHVVEASLKTLYPDYKLAGITVRENEVRIDFFTNGSEFSSEQAEEVIRKAVEIAKNSRVEVDEIERSRVEEMLKNSGETFLLDLMKRIEKPKLIKIGNILTICENSIHLPDLSIIKKIEVTNLSTSHWMGREDAPLLTSIHVTGFPSEFDENLYSARKEEAMKRDHVMLGKEMDLFLTSPLVGAGIILWPPNGAIMKRALEDYIVKVHMKKGYQLVSTPVISSAELFKISGHLSHYRQNMFLFNLDEKEHAIKPMNCPFHIIIFKRKKWSYKELPVRYFELGNVHRYERAGTLHGLTRVRGFTQDDAHIFAREDQIEEEISGVLKLTKEIYDTMGLKDYKFILSLRDPSDKESYMGSEEIWQKAEVALENALKSLNVQYTKSIGDAAFYGPKIDVIFTDALGREWQCATIQLDFNLPERFDLTYIDKDNKEKRLVMIHRAILGSIERFIGILLEQYAGRLPLWISPIQVAVLPVEESDPQQVKRAEEINNYLMQSGIRTQLMVEGRLNARLRDARLLRIPLIAVIGKSELENGSLTVSYLTYGEDSDKRYKPKEEKLSFSSEKEFVEWIKNKVREQTGGVL